MRCNARPWWLVAILFMQCFVVSVVWGAPNDSQKEEERYRVKIPAWRIVEVDKNVADVRELTGDAQTKAIEALKTATSAGGEGESADRLRALGELFNKYSFEAVEKIAKAKHFETPGGKPGATVGQDMAVLRRQMINHAMAETIKALDPDGKLTIGMLDSGNKNSGIASDVDQTVFVIPRDLGDKLGVTVEGVIERFNAAFEAKFGCKPAKMGIESMNGNDFYPDWRQRHSKELFSAEARRVVHEKRKNPEAYRSEGELKIQAEGRGWKALQEHHARVEALDHARTRIEEIKNKGSLTAEDEGRMRQIESELLSRYAGDYPAKSIAELAQKFNKDSPWTEVRSNPDGEPRVSQMEDPKGKVLKARPEIAERFAFDGSWDNWIMYEHHAHNRRKYLLRSIAEGPGLLRRIEEGKPLTTFEYEKVYAGGNAEADLKAFLKETYQSRKGQPALSDDQLERYKNCLDVAARERLRHKGEDAKYKGMSDVEVWGKYWPALSEAETRMYADVPKESLDKMLLDRATRAWEMDAREIMMENLIRTVSTPAELLDGPKLRDRIVSRVQTDHPRAKPAMLRRAVREQLYSGIHDLISTEHAKELVADPETKKTLGARNKDLVDRLLESIKGTAYEAEVRQIVADAAAARIRIEPGETKFRQAVYGYLADQVKARYQSAGETYESAKQKYAEFRSNPEYVARQMLQGAAERLAARGETYKTWASGVAGFQPKAFHGLIPVKGPLPIELDMKGVEFSGAKLFNNIRSPGNVDSVLTVMLAYQERGAEAAAWAAGFEMVMNVPGVAQLNAVKDLVVHQQPQGVVMLGSAMIVPGLGQAFIVINIGKTSVMLLGNFVFETLNNDTADLLYQGFLEQDAGWLTAGTKRPFQGQRVSLLHHVPIRVVLVPVVGPDGVVMKDDKGEVVMNPVWDRYSQAEAQELFNVFPEEYLPLAMLGVLGGGNEWNKAFAAVRDDIANPRGNFEARRAGMYYHFRNAIEPKLREQNIDIHEDEAAAIIHAFFMDYLDQWINGRGAFADFDENVLISRRFEVSESLNNQALRAKIATRATSDFIRSYYLIKGSVIDMKSIERSTERRVREMRGGDVIEEANMVIQAIHEARQVKPDIDMADAFHALFRANREIAREEDEEKGRPYARVRPRVVMSDGAGDGESRGGEMHEAVDFVVSVVADPERFPPPYRIDVQWQTREHTAEATGPMPELSVAEQRKQDQAQADRIAAGDNTDTLLAYVRVFDAKNTEIEVVGDQQMPIRIGELKVSKPQKGSLNLKVAVSKKVQDKAAAPAASPAPVPAPVAAQPQYETTYETYDPKKASAWGDEWGGQDVERLEGQLWARWEDCPLGMSYYVQAQVVGGSPAYDKTEERSIWAQRHFPDQEPKASKPQAEGEQKDQPVAEVESADARANIFVVPFTWPRGHVGQFRIKGRILAFSKHYSGDGWKKADPFAVYPFDEPFSISDERASTDVELMMFYGKGLAQDADVSAYEKQFDERGAPLSRSQAFGPWANPLKPGERRGATRYVGAYEKFDPVNTTPRGYDWGKDSANQGGQPQMWVTWKEAPPEHHYIYEVKISGGTPPHTHADHDYLSALRSFPPFEESPKYGGNCFVIPVRFPEGHGGSFDLEATIYAFKAFPRLAPSEQDPRTWRDMTPDAKQSFRTTLEVAKITPEAEATYGAISPMGTVNGSIKLRGHQPGPRVGKVTGGGKTCFTIVDEYISFKLYGVGKIEEVSVTFPNYGQEMTLRVPITLKPADWSGPKTVDPKAVAAAQKDIEFMTRTPLEKTSIGPGDVAEGYSRLAQCYIVGGSEPMDFEAYKAAQLKQIEYISMSVEASKDSKTRSGWHGSKGARFNEIASRALALGDVATWKQFMQQGDAERALAGIEQKYRNRDKSGALRVEAEHLFRQTGDLQAARTMVEQSIELARSSADDPAKFSPMPNPFDLNDRFETGVEELSMMYVLKDLAYKAEKKQPTQQVQRSKPDELNFLVEIGFAQIDGDGNYRPTAAGLAALPADGVIRPGPALRRFRR